MRYKDMVKSILRGSMQGLIKQVKIPCIAENEQKFIAIQKSSIRS